MLCVIDISTLNKTYLIFEFIHQHNSQILQQALIQSKAHTTKSVYMLSSTNTKSVHVRNPVQMADSLQEVGRGYVICFVLGPGILETLLQNCVTAICVPVQVFSSHTCVYQLRLSSQFGDQLVYTDTLCCGFLVQSVVPTCRTRQTFSNYSRIGVFSIVLKHIDSYFLFLFYSISSLQP